ncbi:MAG: hypothetical protein JJU46_11090 [Balneolaceae bacterium]|nr:hypothetical protein [Balneolaceae bacterium]MCH8549365.1 hypothetical protein [Balneolaceae bacterium]
MFDSVHPDRARIPEFQFSFLIFLLAFIIAGCSTDSGDSPSLFASGEFLNLEFTEQEVYKVEVKDNTLFAGTSDGFMVFDLENGVQTGHHKPESRVRTFLIIEDDFWLISTAYLGGTQDNAILKSEDQGETWRDFSNGYAEGWERDPLTPNTMDYHTDSEQPVIFARTLPALFVARSTDGGASWENVQGDWSNPGVGASRFIKIDRNNSENIWAGGSGSQFNSYMIKSTNGGDDWEFVESFSESSSTIYNMTIRHGHSSHLLAGISGGILKSTNMGTDWQTVYTGINATTLQKSQRNPDVIFASGQNSSGTLFFLTSNDFGDTWTEQDYGEGPAELYINDLASVVQDGEEVLYFATNSGIFSFGLE